MFKVEVPKQEPKLDVYGVANFIAGYEDFKSNCYIDGQDEKGNALYSQGFGQKCTSKSLSRKKALNTLNAEVRRLNQLIKRDWNNNQRTAMISFLYNHPQKQLLHIENINNNPQKFLDELKWKSENHIYIGGVRQGGLKKRRIAEYNLIINL